MFRFFLIKIWYVSTVLDDCSDFTRPMFCLSRLKMGMFWLCSTYISIMLDSGFVFLDHNWVCFDCARRVFWLFPSKLDKFRLWSKYVLIVLMKVGHILTHMFRSFWQNAHISTVLNLCSDYACCIFWLVRSKVGMFRLSRSKFGRFWLCSTFVLIMLDVCFDFLDHNWVCFDCARPIFRLSRPEIGMFGLCSKYVLLFSIETGYVLTMLDICFDYARHMLRLSWSELGIFWLCSTYVSTFLDLLCFDFLVQKWAYFDCARPKFRLCSTYVSYFLDQNWVGFDCARLRFWKKIIHAFQRNSKQQNCL